MSIKLKNRKEHFSILLEICAQTAVEMGIVVNRTFNFFSPMNLASARDPFDIDADPNHGSNPKQWIQIFLDFRFF